MMGGVSLNSGSAIRVLAVDKGYELTACRCSLRLLFGSRGAAVPPRGLFFGRHTRDIDRLDWESAVERRWMNQLGSGMALKCEALL